MKLNYGEIFKRPHESIDGTIQRILASNPAATYQSIREFKRDTPDQTIPENVYYGNIIAPIHRTLLIGYERFLKQKHLQSELGSPIEHHIIYEQSSKRTCPECARFNYHSPLYHLTWVNKCPIHGKLITLLCPDCKKPWPIGIEARRSQCARCRLDYDFQERAKNFQKVDNTEYRSFIVLNNLIEKQMTNSELFSGLTTQFWSREKMQFYHANFPSVLLSTARSSKKLLDGFGCSVQPMKTFRYSLRKAFTMRRLSHWKRNAITLNNEFYDNPISIPNVLTWNVKIPKHLLRARHRAFDIICQEIKLHCGFGYTPEINYSNMFGYRKKDCPYSIALTFWYYYLLKSPEKQHHYLTSIENPFYGPNTGKFFPDPVVPVTYVSINNELYHLTKKAQETIYLNDLLEMYKILYSYAKVFLETVNSMQCESVRYDIVANNCLIDPATGTNLAYYAEKDSIKIIIPKSDLPENFKLEPYQFLLLVEQPASRLDSMQLIQRHSEQFELLYDYSI